MSHSAWTRNWLVFKNEMSCNSNFSRAQSGLLNSSQERVLLLSMEFYCSPGLFWNQYFSRRKVGQLSGKQENKHYGHFLPHSFLKTVTFKVLKLRTYYERYFLPQNVLFLCDKSFLHWLSEQRFTFLRYLLFEIELKTVRVRTHRKGLEEWRPNAMISEKRRWMTRDSGGGDSLPCAACIFLIGLKKHLLNAL